MTIPNRRSWSTQQHIIWMTPCSILRDYDGVVFCWDCFFYAVYKHSGQGIPIKPPKNFGSWNDSRNRSCNSESTVHCTYYYVVLLTRNFCVDEHACVFSKKTCCQSYYCDTLRQTNIAGWKMDPDWRCISYGKMGYSSNRYVILPEGRFLNALSLNKSINISFTIKVRQSPWTRCAEYREILQWWCQRHWEDGSWV